MKNCIQWADALRKFYHHPRVYGPPAWRLEWRKEDGKLEKDEENIKEEEKHIVVTGSSGASAT